MDDEPESGQQSGNGREPHGPAFSATRQGRDRTLEAVHALESAVDRATPGREAEWLHELGEALTALHGAVVAEQVESERPDSLLSMIERDFPRRAGPRVRHLREQHDDIVNQLHRLSRQVQRRAGEGEGDVSDLRQRVAAVVAAIRSRRAREGDLVYEAVVMDLGNPGD